MKKRGRYYKSLREYENAGGNARGKKTRLVSMFPGAFPVCGGTSGGTPATLYG